MYQKYDLNFINNEKKDQIIISNSKNCILQFLLENPCNFICSSFCLSNGDDETEQGNATCDTEPLWGGGWQGEPQTGVGILGIIGEGD